MGNEKVSMQFVQVNDLYINLAHVVWVERGTDGDCVIHFSDQTQRDLSSQDAERFTRGMLEAALIHKK